jgi:hypothetical protein
MGASDVGIHTSTEIEFRRRGENGSVRVHKSTRRLGTKWMMMILKVECLVGRNGKIYVSFVSTL